MEYGIDYDCVHNNINGVAKYWSGRMPTMCMEELAELIQAISKKERLCRDSDEHLKEEIADVYISLYALMEHYYIESDEIIILMNEKLTKDMGNKNELMRFLLNITELNNIRAYNALVRNGIDSVEKLVYIVKKSNRVWYKDIKGLGPTSAKLIEDVILGHCEQFIFENLV